MSISWELRAATAQWGLDPDCALPILSKALEHTFLGWYSWPCIPTPSVVVQLFLGLLNPGLASFLLVMGIYLLLLSRTPAQGVAGGATSNNSEPLTSVSNSLEPYSFLSRLTIMLSHVSLLNDWTKCGMLFSRQIPINLYSHWMYRFLVYCLYMHIFTEYSDDLSCWPCQMHCSAASL